MTCLYKKTLYYLMAFVTIVLAFLFGKVMVANAAQVDKIYNYLNTIYERKPESFKDYGDFIFAELKDGNIAIVGYIGSDSNVTFPNKLDGKKVEAVFGNFIGNYHGFYLDYSAVEEIAFSEGIEYIGMFSNFRDEISKGDVFQGGWYRDGSYPTDETIYEYLENRSEISFYVNLKKVILPNSLKEIATKTFAGLNYITNIGTKKTSEEDRLYLPENVEYIGSAAFAECLGIKNAILPQKTESISNGLFFNCINLENVVMSDNTKEIKDYAFYNCRALENVSLSMPLETIGSFGFYNSGLTKIEFNDNLRKVGEKSFSNCNNLEEVTVNSKETEIDYMFDEEELGYIDLVIKCRSYSKALSFAKMARLKYELINGDTADIVSQVDEEEYNNNLRETEYINEDEKQAEPPPKDSSAGNTININIQDSKKESSKRESESDSSIAESKEESKDDSSSVADVSEKTENSNSSSGTTVIIILLSVLIALMIGGFAVYFLKIRKKQ